MTALVTRDIGYTVGSRRMMGAFAAARGAPRPGVLILHDAFGLDHFCIGIAERLAGEGYAALALDLWGDRRRFTTPEGAMVEINGLLTDRADWMARVEAARACLAAQSEVDGSRLAALGYCFGGSTALEFVRRGGALQAVVSFHGGLDFVGPEWSAERTKTKLLLCTGSEDPLVPWTSLTAFQDNLRRGGIVDWEVDLYSDTKHSFTRPDALRQSTPERVAYSPRADRRSWAAMLRLFQENFGS